MADGQVRLRENDIIVAVRRLPKKVREFAEETGLYIAGGYVRDAIRGEHPTDIDFWGSSMRIRDGISKFENDFKLEKIETDNATTFRAKPIPVQFIQRWTYDTSEKCIEGFDFTICQAVIWYHRDVRQWRGLCSEDFYADLACKRLVYTRPTRDEDAGASILRLRKFLKRGYTIRIDSLAALLAQFYDKIRSDSRFAENRIESVIMGMLKEVDPLFIEGGFHDDDGVAEPFESSDH